MYLFHADFFLSSPSPFLSFFIFLGGVGCAEVGKGGTTFVCLILIYFFSLTCCFRCDHVLSVKFTALGITQICSPFLSAAIHLFVSTYLLFSVRSCTFCKVYGPRYNPDLLSFSVCSYSFICFHLLAVFGVLMYSNKVYGPRYNPNLLSFSVCS